MSSRGRYITLRDYIRVLVRYAPAIVVIALIGAAAGYVTAKRETAVFKTTASVSFQDPTQDLPLAGLAPNTFQAPGEFAAINSETLTRPGVMAAVKKLLGTPLPASSLAGAVSSQVSLAGLLDITASSSSPAFAAQLANAAAQVVVNQSNQQTQAQLGSVVNDIRHRIGAIVTNPKPAPGASTQLLYYEDELARLTTLIKFVRSAQVAQVAAVPGTPVSPKPFQSGLIGLGVGLLLAVTLAFLRDSMDRRLRNPGDIESSLSLPIVGHIREHVMGRIAQAANGGGDYAPDIEAFRILRRNLEFLSIDDPPRSIVVTSAVPEEGKTTIAGSLAFAMASAGKRTLLVDCDLRRPDLSKHLGIESSPGLTDYLAGEATPEQILRTVEFEDAPSVDGTSVNGSKPELTRALVCIPAGSPTSRAAELLGSARFAEFLEQVRSAYDVVILDSSPLLPVADTREMLPQVDGVVLCARQFRTTRDQALAAKAALSRFPERPTGVVVTGIKPHRDDYEAYSYAYDYS